MAGYRQPWQMTYQSPATVNGKPDVGKSSYESPWTALRSARQAMASRKRRAPQSRITVINKDTGDMIFCWDGVTGEFFEKEI